MRKFSVVIFLALIFGGSAAFFEKSKSEQAKEYAQQARDKVFDSAGVPNTKIGELYHKGAAKVDRLMGDTYNQRRHEALVAAKKLNEGVGEAYDTYEPKLEAAYEKAKEWAGVAGEKAIDAKDAAYDAAGVPNTKIGELYHQGAAKFDNMVGKDFDARRHEALVAAKRMNDDPSNVVHNVRPLAHGIFSQLKEWFGIASDKAVEMKDQAYDRAGVPTTKVGEMYHSGAAKVDRVLGDNMNARKHEALVAAKRLNQDPSEILDYASEGLREGMVNVKNMRRSSSRFGFKTIIMLALFCGALYYLFGPNKEHVKAAAHKAKGKMHEVKGDFEDAKEKASKGKASELFEHAKEKGKELLEKGKEKFEDLRHQAKSKGEELADKGKESMSQAKAKGHELADKGKENLQQMKNKGEELADKGKENVQQLKNKGEELADKGKEGFQQMKNKGQEIANKGKETFHNENERPSNIAAH
jgi:hypothetical protein